MKLSRRVLELDESATLQVSARAARMRTEGVDVIGFGAGEPDFDTPEHIREAGVAALRAGHTRYPTPSSGIPVAKEAVCTKFLRDDGLSYKPDQVVITAGAKLAVYLALHSLLEPGDEAIVPAPYWVSYPTLVQLTGATPVFVRGLESRDFKLTPDDIRRAITPRTRVFIFNSPSNPGGFTYHPDEVRALAGVLADYDVTVISDEIYDRLVYEGQKTLSFAAVSQRAYEQTLTVNSASKTYAMTGWRAAYAAGPEYLIAAMSRLQTQNTSGAATFTQYALAAALASSQEVVEEMRQEFERRARYMWERLNSIPGVRCVRPTGAFYCFPNIGEAAQRRGIGTSLEFAERLLAEAHVAVVPGAPFGFDDHIRMSFAASMDHIRTGLDRMEAWLRR